MLSKYYTCTTEMVKADTDFVSALINEIDKKTTITSVTQINPGGTLGIFLRGNLDGKKVFIKSHHPNDMAAKNLQKEIYLMQVLYGNILDIEKFELKVAGYNQKIMIMDFLQMTSLNYTISDVKTLIKSYSAKLKNLDVNQINYKISDFEKAAIVSCEELMKRNFMGKDTYIFCKKAIKNFKTYSEVEREICHGDLSNVNIYNRKDALIALDWEDAMECVPHYDILYWLTFFSSRKYYDSLLFKELEINEEYGKDLMVMIILVKSYISFMNGTYMKNRLSIQDRLSEVINM